MKKIAVLTSLLALVACGGGSGGGNNPGGIPSEAGALVGYEEDPRSFGAAFGGTIKK